MPFPSAAACPMQTADARRPWSLGRGGQTPSSIKFRTKSSGKTLTRILADSILIRLHSPHPLRSPLPRCALRTSDLIYEAAFSGEDNGEEAGRILGGREKEGRKAVNYAIRSTHWTGKWRQPRSGRLLPLLPLASIRLQVTRWQNRFFQTFGRAEADYSDCRTKEALGFQIKGTQGR